MLSRACQTSLSIGFSREEYWSGLSSSNIPPPGDLPDPGNEPMSLTSPALAGGFFTTRVSLEEEIESSFLGIFYFLTKSDIFCLNYSASRSENPSKIPPDLFFKSLSFEGRLQKDSVCTGGAWKGLASVSGVEMGFEPRLVRLKTQPLVIRLPPVQSLHRPMRFLVNDQTSPWSTTLELGGTGETRKTRILDGGALWVPIL